MCRVSRHHLQQQLSASLCMLCLFLSLSRSVSPQDLAVSPYLWASFQTDAEMLSIERLAAAGGAPPQEGTSSKEGGPSGPPPILSYLDLRKPGWTGHWRLQQDLAIIRDRVTKE